MTARISLALATCALLAAGCGDNHQPHTGDIFGDLGDPLPEASPSQLLTFERGFDVGLKRFTPAEGLGPNLNVTFCLACHEKPVFGGAGGRYRNFLLVGQSLPDGSFTPTGINGVQSQFTIAEEARVPTDGDTNVMATRNPIPFFGAGLIASIPEEEILRHEDPDDADGDGISGRANYDRGFIGRFGRKSQNATIETFIRGPLFNHLGITTNPLPDERRAELPVPGVSAAEMSARIQARNRELVGDPRIVFQVGAPDEPTVDSDGVPDPEMSENELFDLISFAMLTAAPRPDEPTAQTERGAAIFESINCTGCHIRELDSPSGPLPLYSDLLIHDMGADLDDGILMGEASGSEFRTAPLWGIAAVGPYLHDGRADTLDEAIRFHGGEATDSRDAYAALSDGERTDLIAFLVSLGGASQRTDGLLPPGLPVPGAGNYGAPPVALTGADLERFTAGRAVFDRDATVAGGLGPKFNGDACRACHFDPVVGGAGPTDVDVIRHGIIDGSGGFQMPNTGTTIAHRHAVDPASRPAIDPATNFTEARQTPPIFGLGLVDRIPREEIIARADPDDVDGDGISGRAHILADGRLGRLGWKADVPSLAEFARDASSAELGLTVPEDSQLTFGATSDNDGVPDPELSAEELAQLIYFMENLGPPPRSSVNPELEAAGEALFEQVGCADCHTPSMQTADGTPVPLYSDLLLHDVQLPYRYGVVSGDAGAREFRTAPLWGLATSAPYMHDGQATTVYDAIILHDAEAAASRAAFLALPLADRAALIAFLESL